MSAYVYFSGVLGTTQEAVWNNWFRNRGSYSRDSEAKEIIERQWVINESQKLLFETDLTLSILLYKYFYYCYPSKSNKL